MLSANLISDRDKNFIYQVAYASCNLDVIKLLYEYDSAIIKKNFSCCFCANLDIVKFLIGNGIKPTYYYLLQIIKAHQADVFWHLVDLFEKEFIYSKGQKYLIEPICEHGSCQMLEKLKEIDIIFNDNFYVNGLNIAIESGKLEIVDYLLKEHCHFEDIKISSILIAAMSRYDNITQYFLDLSRKIGA